MEGGRTGNRNKKQEKDDEGQGKEHGIERKDEKEKEGGGGLMWTRRRTLRK